MAAGSSNSLVKDAIVSVLYDTSGPQVNVKGISQDLVRGNVIDVSLEQRILSQQTDSDSQHILAQRLHNYGTLESVKRLCKVLRKTANRYHSHASVAEKLEEACGFSSLTEESQSTPNVTSGGEQTKWTLDNHCLFMSHSSKNKDIVDKLVQALRGLGVNVWYDKDEIRLGNEWDRKIATDMPNMYGFICCMSEDFFDSDICFQELRVFRDAHRNKRIPYGNVFPIVIDQSFKEVKQDWQMQLPKQTHYKKWPDDKRDILQTLVSAVKD